MEIKVDDKKRILEINLEHIKSGNAKDVVVISEQNYNEFINFLQENERYEEMSLLRDNKNFLLGL